MLFMDILASRGWLLMIKTKTHFPGLGCFFSIHPVSKLVLFIILALPSISHS